MLDRDLADLYEVETRALNHAVRRNIERFPDDFMFQLTGDETEALKSQSVILKAGRGQHSKFLPLAFTEQGVAMLSSVLKSKRAVQVNIEIMRAFTQLRRFVLDNADLRQDLDQLRRQSDERFQIVFETLDRLLTTEKPPRRKIGF